jgi:hypothetical protein
VDGKLLAKRRYQPQKHSVIASNLSAGQVVIGPIPEATEQGIKSAEQGADSADQRSTWEAPASATARLGAVPGRSPEPGGYQASPVDAASAIHRLIISVT